jgi:hypothetical protein
MLEPESNMPRIDRRTFLGVASAAILADGLCPAASLAAATPDRIKPMALGLLISPFGAPEANIRRVHELVRPAQGEGLLGRIHHLCELVRLCLTNSGSRQFPRHCLGNWYFRGLSKRYLGNWK